MKTLKNDSKVLTTKNISSYKINSSLVFKRAHLTYKELIDISIENRSGLVWSNCLKQAWFEAKQTKQNIIDKINNGYDSAFKLSQIIVPDQPIRNEILTSANGVEIEYNAIYKKYFKSIYNSLNYKLNYQNPDLCQDLTQDTFIVLHKFISKYDTELSQVNTLLNRIASNKLIDYIRKQKNNKTVRVSAWTNDKGDEIIQFSYDYDSTEIENNISKTKQNLFAAIETLNPVQKKAIELQYLQKKSYIEISEILNVSMTNCKQILFRAKNKLEKNSKILVLND